MEAIILDGEQRSALAVTRSLGRKGIKVTVGSEKKPSLSSCSRYCTRSFTYPSPYNDPVGFKQVLIDTAINTPNSILFPMTDVTLTEILLNRGELPENLLIPFVDYDRYIHLTDKINLFRLARNMNLPIPTTFLSTDFESNESIIEAVIKFGFPVVVKPNFSKIRTEKGWIGAGVHYAKNEKDLREILSRDIVKRFPFLIQERVDGPGVGVFLLMKNGEVIAKFAHKRIREKPPSGGVSVLCESIEPPVEALETAVMLLTKLHWTGVAMVEFKIDRVQNIAKLIEVNARFWGSLQLAITSGVDFPYLLYQLAVGDRILEPARYTIGLRSRWELGDLDHLLSRLLKNPSILNLSSNYPARITLIKDFLFDYFRPSVKNEIFRYNDIKPLFHEMKGYISYLFYRRNCNMNSLN
jgi:predicted ATP-grasp superfamily ATP-dependent carboligase